LVGVGCGEGGWGGGGGLGGGGGGVAHPWARVRVGRPGDARRACVELPTVGRAGGRAGTDVSASLGGDCLLWWSPYLLHVFCCFVALARLSFSLHPPSHCRPVRLPTKSGSGAPGWYPSAWTAGTTIATGCTWRCGGTGGGCEERPTRASWKLSFVFLWRNPRVRGVAVAVRGAVGGGDGGAAAAGRVAWPLGRVRRCESAAVVCVRARSAGGGRSSGGRARRRHHESPRPWPVAGGGERRGRRWSLPTHVQYRHGVRQVCASTARRHGPFSFFLMVCFYTGGACPDRL